jgi:transposase
MKTSSKKILTPLQYEVLIKNLQGDLPGSYRQRIEIMLLANNGKTQMEICQEIGCSGTTASHWIHVAQSGMAHKWQDCPLGRPKTVSDEYLVRLQELLNTSPYDHGYVFSRWTVAWLNKHLHKELAIKVSDRHLRRLMKQLNLSTKSIHHSQADDRAQSTLVEMKDRHSIPISRILVADL